MDNPELFKAKFAYTHTTKFFKKEFAIGKALHKVAELKASWLEVTVEDAILALENEIAEATIIIDDDIKRMYDLEEVDEIKQQLILMFDFFIKQVPEWIPEWKIEDDNFVWYIDLLTDEEIIDYKVVSNFSWLTEWYLIQWAVYAKFHPDKKRIRFIELTKPKTDFKYTKKDDIIDMIEREYSIDLTDAMVDRKMTRELLVEKYPITWCGRKDVVIPVTPELLAFSEQIYTKAIELRQLAYDLQESWDKNDLFSYRVYEFRNLIKSFKKSLNEPTTEEEL